MKRIRITHVTEYHYHKPVTFGPHRAMLRPREGHDLHIASSKLMIEPEASVRWVRDIYGNSIAIITFAEPARKLGILSEIDVDLYDDTPIDCLVDPLAQSYPFQYPANEQVEIVPYRVPSYPHDGPAVQNWLLDLYSPGQLINTSELLYKLNTRIHETFRYNARYEPGVQLPCQTLARESGTCRDYAVFMMEAARHWGFASRFVTGYIQMGEGQHGATHAWTEVYIPARAGGASIPRTTSSPAPSMSPSRLPVSKRRRCQFPVPGKGRQTPGIGWKSPFRSSPYDDVSRGAPQPV